MIPSVCQPPPTPEALRFEQAATKSEIVTDLQDILKDEKKTAAQKITDFKHIFNKKKTVLSQGDDPVSKRVIDAISTCLTKGLKAAYRQWQEQKSEVDKMEQITSMHATRRPSRH